VDSSERFREKRTDESILVGDVAGAAARARTKWMMPGAGEVGSVGRAFLDWGAAAAW
jgi:5,10-methylene-tetrahydrofolate dehydrogenase/methenyl tetrahydrofolate cyclohydrolase